MWQYVFPYFKRALFPDTDLMGHSIIPIELGEDIHIYQYLNIIPIQIKYILLLQTCLSVCIMV